MAVLNCSINRDTLYLGGGLAERERITSGQDKGKETYKYHLRAGGQNIGYITQHFANGKFQSFTHETTRYLLSDHLGSIDVILSNAGKKIRNLSFSAWGERRLGNWKAASPTRLESTVAALNKESMKLGFTGHEMDDAVGLVNMKGRLYNAKIGRFISADPHIQSPSDTQSYNRYTYVKNNPLSYTDQSGYFLKGLFKKIGHFLHKWGRTIAAIGLSFITGGVAMGIFGTGFWGVTIAGAVGGATAGLVSTGTLRGALRGAVFGALSAGVAYGIKLNVQEGWGRAIAHGASQGGISLLRGNKFGDGFVGGFFDHVSSWYTKGLGSGRPWGVPARTTAAAMVGGTISSIVGGKFANGAVTSAFTHLFNSEAGRRSGGGRSGGGLVKGALDVVGKIWALPNTLLGLAYGGAGHVYGLFTGTNPYITFGHNAVQFINNPFVQDGTALTLGNTILYGNGVPPSANNSYGDPSVNIGFHEEAHTYQYQALGIFYAPAYLLSGGFSGPGGNPFEQSAQDYGRNPGKGRWWP